MTELTEATAIILHPGDVAVLTFDRMISQSEAERIRAVWAEKAPKNDCIILAGGATVSAVIPRV